ncbi:TPA: DUF551 domain-containing protein [Klebsiella pneumoniae]|nr:DUF551 domain-containing protein [Klebsiella pneumoniae]
MINRDKLEHILEYARQQRHIGQSCKVPPEDMVEIMERLLSACNSPAIPEGSASMLRRWLAFGRGMQNAGSQLPHNLIAETESMLAASPQPQNSPQNIPEIIPDGWIPVSEHLPKEKGVYQVWNGKYVDNVPFWFGSFQSLHSELITHWMPLPAAPQETNS